MTRNNRSADVELYLSGFLQGVPGAWLRTETLYQGYVNWCGSVGRAVLPLVAFARGLAAALPPEAQARHRRKGVPTRGWKLWPNSLRQEFLEHLTE